MENTPKSNPPRIIYWVYIPGETYLYGRIGREPQNVLGVSERRGAIKLIFACMITILMGPSLINAAT